MFPPLKRGGSKIVYFQVILGRRQRLNLSTNVFGTKHARPIDERKKDFKTVKFLPKFGQLLRTNS